MSGFDIGALLPPYLNLPPHLSAHKYFFVCTLTVAAWDTLVLSPRSWRLMKTKEWPVLKIVFQFLRYLMPAEFIIVGEYIVQLLHFLFLHYYLFIFMSVDTVAEYRFPLQRSPSSTQNSPEACAINSTYSNLSAL